VKFLLDTHVWIWLLSNPAKLSPTVSKTLADAKNEIWLSPVSVWELTILAAKGRAVAAANIEEWIRNALRTAPLKEAPLTFDVALATNAFRARHRDPADAFLAATAKVYGLTLVTADAALLASKEIATLAGR
jgi:PIN domain nuclease of toxin-antitoxin system